MALLCSTACVAGARRECACMGPAQGRWVDWCWLIAAQLTRVLPPPMYPASICGMAPLCFRSLFNNDLGSEGGVAIGEALKVNTSVQTIE